MTARGRKRLGLAAATAVVIGAVSWLAVIAGDGAPERSRAADADADATLTTTDDGVAAAAATAAAADLAAARAEARQRLPAQPVVLPPRAPRTDALPEPRPRSEF